MDIRMHMPMYLDFDVNFCCTEYFICSVSCSLIICREKFRNLNIETVVFWWLCSGFSLIMNEKVFHVNIMSFSLSFLLFCYLFFPPAFPFHYSKLDLRGRCCFWMLRVSDCIRVLRGRVNKRTRALSLGYTNKQLCTIWFH